MEDNVQDKKEEQNQNEEQDNNYDEENGEEEVGEEEANLNYNGEYEGDLEGEEEAQEENVEEIQNDIEGEEMEENQENQENENNEEQLVEEEYQQMNNQNEEIQNENINDNGKGEKNINNNINNEINHEINNKEENKIENLSINNINEKNINNKLEISADKDNNNSINTKKLSNIQRIELINNKLNLNINKIQNKAKTKKENKIENEIDNEQYDFNKININKRKNDILSEVLNKIQDFKQKKDNFDNARERYNSNQILDNLDKEITKGLDRLNNKRINIEDKNIDISDTNKVEKKILRNPKFKEIITMINDKEGKKYKRNYNLGKNDLLNIVNNKKRNDIFGNINFFTQKRNNNMFNTFQNNPVKKIGLDNFYISCIDGKAIVNGIRKDIPIVSKFNNINYRLNNYNNNMFDDYKKINLTLDNFNMTRKRNNILNFQNKVTFKEGKNNRQFNLNIGGDDTNINNKLKRNFMNENWNKDNNYFKGGLKYFK